MPEEIKIFGAALDALPSPERVALKLAYIRSLRDRSSMEKGWIDPYDFIKARVTEGLTLNHKIKWSGKVSIPSWLSPKPNIIDWPRLSIDRLIQFLERDGCWECALRVADYINREVVPGMPVMIGVDHGLTGGPIMTMAERYPDLNVIILDAHFDVMNKDKSGRQNRQDPKVGFPMRQDREITSNTQWNYYECGNFLDFLLKKRMIAPKNLWILGVQDEIYKELKKRGNCSKNLNPNMESIKKWIRKGVHVIFKHEVQSGNFKMVLNGPTYLSIDMDVGSLSSIYSARFMTSYGLNAAEFLKLLHKVSRFIRKSHYPLVGLDIMEFDVHFFGAVKERKMNDRADEIVKEIFRLFINKNGRPSPSRNFS